ncbi:MAG TPA: hypothetical protein VHX44_12455 [Planctomycetota bacterium]|jgi:predicted  nucleic acid-binding Zn-ribbon protein|nr:hypothetical protein [Planctomycetota bacterium]
MSGVADKYRTHIRELEAQRAREEKELKTATDAQGRTTLAQNIKALTGQIAEQKKRFAAMG